MLYRSLLVIEYGAFDPEFVRLSHVLCDRGLIADG